MQLGRHGWDIHALSAGLGVAAAGGEGGGGEG
jgi:hypothetical protein